MPNWAFEITGLSAAYGTAPVLRDLDLRVARGELLAVLGPSGCGKTSLLRCMAGFLEPVAGQICIGDEIVAAPRWSMQPERRQVGIVFQSYALWPHMTAIENVAYPWKVRGFGRRERQARAAGLLARVGLRGFEQRRPSSLSGGQQQRVALARALAGEPRILLLDEPFSSVDATLRQELQDLVLDICRSGALTTVLTTHDQAEAFALADRIAILREGALVQTGTPRDVYERPANAFVARFIGNNNLLAVRVSGRMDGSTAVRLPDGQEINVAAAPPIGTGTALLCVRPGCVALSGAAGGLMGTILRSSLRDGHAEYRVQTCGTVLRVWEPGLPDRAPGDRVGMTFSQAQLFPPEGSPSDE